MPLHKVFVSYHHGGDQRYATLLRDFYGAENTIIDRSLQAEIDSDDDDEILQVIRTKHLGDSTVTIVLVGEDTWSRKWVDWEIYSSLRPYDDRTINGLLGIRLPGAYEWKPVGIQLPAPMRLPPRLADNVSFVETSTGKRQTGFAKLIDWSDIKPTFFMRHVPGLCSDEISAKRAKLRRWIDAAFANRSRVERIDNSRARMRDNVAAHWWQT